MNEFLALVYYDSIQNVVPSYDQRRHVPVRESTWLAACKHSFTHFEVAYSYKYEILALAIFIFICITAMLNRCYNPTVSTFGYGE